LAEIAAFVAMRDCRFNADGSKFLDVVRVGESIVHKDVFVGLKRTLTPPPAALAS
jgi:hypothetical protein